MKLVELGTILHMDKGKKPQKQQEKYKEGYLPYVDIQAFEEGIIKSYADPQKCLLCEDGDLLIVCDGSRSGLTGRAIKGVVGSTLSKISADGLCTEYLQYFIQSKYTLLNTRKKGTGTPHLNAELLKKSKLVIPTQTEQERIVSKIEELFSKLDASVAELKTAKEKLKVYRQAVLKEAFDSVRSDCMTTTIKSVCKTIKVGIVIKPTQYYVKTDGVFAFRNANVRRNYIEDNDWAMISQEGHQKNLKSQVHTDDVLIARSGVNLGMAAAVPEKYDGYNAIDIVIAVPKKNFVLPKYLAQYTNSPYGVEIVKKNQHGAAQGHLNVKEYGNLPIFLPNISVQNELLQKIESRLSVCDSIEQTIDTSLQQAEALRQSILKQAFEGRLIE